MLILCMLTFATDFMRIKFKNYGCIEKYEVDIIEEVNLERSTTAIDLMRIKLKDGNIKISVFFALGFFAVCHRKAKVEELFTLCSHICTV